jgi:putative intracellular protease/amidase
MKPIVYLLVFDGLADWEPAHALCELRRSGKFDVLTAGFTRQTITTMGGLKVVPDLTLDQVKAQDSVLLVVPGGDMWQEQSQPAVESLLRRFHDQEVPIAAICGATLEIARAGLTRGIRHTSNALAYLKSMVPDYRDEAFYVDELAVSDQGVITASGLGGVEFAREIFGLLKLYDDSDLRTWYEMFKHGLVPAPGLPSS